MANNNQTVDRIQVIWNMIGGDDVVNRLIAGKAKLVVETVPRLTALMSFNLPTSERNVHDFFQNKNGLSMSGGFVEYILAAAQTHSRRANDAMLGYSDVSVADWDCEICAELPKGYVFTDVTVFLVSLAALIEAQWLNEVSGVLQNKLHRKCSYSNIFYVKIASKVFAVRVFWDYLQSEWRCTADHLDNGERKEGDRVFSATDALSL